MYNFYGSKILFVTQIWYVIMIFLTLRVLRAFYPIVHALITFYAFMLPSYVTIMFNVYGYLCIKFYPDFNHFSYWFNEIVHRHTSSLWSVVTKWGGLAQQLVGVLKRDACGDVEPLCLWNFVQWPKVMFHLIFLTPSVWKVFIRLLTVPAHGFMLPSNVKILFYWK